MWILFMVTMLGQTPIDTFKTFKACEAEATKYRVAFANQREVYSCEKKQ